MWMTYPRCNNDLTHSMLTHLGSTTSGVTHSGLSVLRLTHHGILSYILAGTSKFEVNCAQVGKIFVLVKLMVGPILVSKNVLESMHVSMICFSLQVSRP